MGGCTCWGGQAPCPLQVEEEKVQTSLWEQGDWLCTPVQSAMPGRMTWHTRAGGGDQVGSRSPGSHGKFETQQACCPLLVSFHFSHLLTTPCGHRWGQIHDEGRDWGRIRKIHCSGVGGPGLAPLVASDVLRQKGHCECDNEEESSATSSVLPVRCWTLTLVSQR